MQRLLEHQAQRFLRENPSQPLAWNVFLTAVGDTYFSIDADRKRLELALELRSKELTDLRIDLAERQLAVAQLKQILSLHGITPEYTSYPCSALSAECIGINETMPLI